jgi:outer membrane receptor for ferric coprogen and ferric-rhodotorulic acid
MVMALHAVCLGLGAAAFSPAQAVETAAVQGARHAVDLPAGPLAEVVGRYSSLVGVTLAFNAAEVRGLQSTGLKGNVSVEEGFSRLLASHGLEAVLTAPGRYTLRRLPQRQGESTLAEVQVSEMALGAVTENSGSYTSGSSNSSTGLALSLKETPQSVSVITRQQMDDQGMVQLADVVKQTAGLILSQSGNMGSDSSPIFSRGFQVENYQVDGVGYLHSNYSSIFQSNDMALYDRVEVVRGATGLMNGIGTPSATINLIRKRPTADFQMNGKVEVGSWDYYRAEADISSSLNEARTLRGRFITAVQDNASFIDRLKESKRIFSGIVEADLSPSTLATVGLTYQEHHATGHARSGRPQFYNDGTPVIWQRSDSAAADWAYSRRESLQAFGSLEHRLENEWRLKGTYTYSKTRFDEQIGYAAGGLPDKASGTGVIIYGGRWAGPPEQNSVDVQASGPFTLFGRKHDLALGATYSHTKQDAEAYHLWYFLPVPNIYTWNGSSPGKPNNSPVGDFNYTEQTRSMYATARFRLTDALSLITGARNTSWQDETYNRSYASNVSTTERRRWDNRLTPYAGLVYELTPQWSAYGSYTDIFKPQSNKDASGNFLDPLLGKSYEVGVKGSLMQNRLNLGLAHYRVQQDNLAVAIPGVFGPDGNQAYRAESGTETRGFEVELAGALARNWQVSTSYARNLSEDKNGQRLNTNIPKESFKVFTSYRLPQIGHGLTVGGGMRWQDATWSDYAWLPGKPRSTQESYAVVDLMAQYGITRDVVATLNLYNALDKSYRTNSGSSYYGEPRNLRVGLNFRF